MTTPIPYTLSTLQKAIAEHLATDPILIAAQVTALAENDGDITAKVEHQLGTLGLLLLVLTPKAVRNGAGHCLDCTIDVVIQVAELPIINRARAGHLTAMDAAEHIAAALDMAHMPPANQPLVAHSITPISQTESIAYNITYTTRAILTQGTPP